MTGHCVGAAGVIEAIISTLAVQNSFYPATINLDNPDPECDLDYVPHKGIEGNIDVAVSASLGFGGHNGVIALRPLACKKACKGRLRPQKISSPNLRFYGYHRTPLLVEGI